MLLDPWGQRRSTSAVSIVSTAAAAGIPLGTLLGDEFVVAQLKGSGAAIELEARIHAHLGVGRGLLAPLADVRNGPRESMQAARGTNCGDGNGQVT